MLLFKQSVQILRFKLGGVNVVGQARRGKCCSSRQAGQMLYVKLGEVNVAVQARRGKC